MRATRGLIVTVFVLAGAAIAGALSSAACTYTASGQGGAPAALQLGDAYVASPGDGGTASAAQNGDD